MSIKKLLAWADANIRPEDFGRFLDVGLSVEFLQKGCELSELFLEFEAEVEEVIEEEMSRTGLDRNEVLEYTEETEDFEQRLKEIRKIAFATAVLVVARQRRDSD